MIDNNKVAKKWEDWAKEALGDNESVSVRTPNISSPLSTCFTICYKIMNWGTATQVTTADVDMPKKDLLGIVKQLQLRCEIYRNPVVKEAYDIVEIWEDENEDKNLSFKIEVNPYCHNKEDVTKDLVEIIAVYQTDSDRECFSEYGLTLNIAEDIEEWQLSFIFETVRRNHYEWLCNIGTRKKLK